VALLRGHTTVTAHMFKLRLTQRQECRMHGDEKDNVCTFMSLFGTDMPKIQNLGSYVLDTQGSRKHDGEWPNKPVANTRLGIIL